MSRLRAITARILLLLICFHIGAPVWALPADPPVSEATQAAEADGSASVTDGLSQEQPAAPEQEPPAAVGEAQPSEGAAPTEGEQPEGAQPEGTDPDRPPGEGREAPATEPAAPGDPEAPSETETPAGPVQPGEEPAPGANPSTLEDRTMASPPIVNIEVEGNETVPAQTILEVVSTRIGDPLLEPRLRRDLQAIFDLGYFTDVRFATPTAPGGIRLVFRVLENPVVQGIEFRGNQVVDSAKLAEVIDTKVGEVLNTRTIYSDIQAINAYYNDELGLLRNPTHVTDVAFEDGRVVLTIVDGITVSEVEVTGVTVFSQEEVERLIRAKPGELFNRKTLEEDLTKVQQLYEDGEWVLDNVDTKIDPDTGKLTINVLEAVVEELRVVGNSKTRTSVVLKNLRTKPGAVLNRRRFQRDLERLKNLGYFRSVEPEFERGSEKGKVILVLDVEEEKTGLATIGVGYAGGGSSGIRSGVTGAVSYSDRNLFGQGKNVSVSWQRGAQISAIALSYFDPAINGNQDSIGVSLFMNEVDGLRQPITVDGQQQFAFYDDNRKGGSFTYGHPLSDDLRVFGTLRHETIEILKDSDSFFTPIGLGTGTLNSVGFSALYDTRDDIFNPHVGTFANGSVNVAGFGGDFSFEKYTLEGRYYLPLGENHTLAMRAWGGMVTGDAPITEYFYAGGPDTLRGYQQNEFFGTRFLVANLEYRFPIGNIKFLRGAVFADAGNAWSPGDTNDDKIYLDAGLGLRITFPALGLGVIRLDYAFGEDGGRTQIGIGQSF